jgi:hypothetical protein
MGDGEMVPLVDNPILYVAKPLKGNMLQGVYLQFLPPSI